VDARAAAECRQTVIDMTYDVMHQIVMLLVAAGNAHCVIMTYTADSSRRYRAITFYVSLHARVVRYEFRLVHLAVHSQHNSQKLSLACMSENSN